MSRTRCGARTRSGAPCKTPAVTGKRRCRMHGGAQGSGAPRGNRNARKHGRYSAAALARRKQVRQWWRRGTLTATLAERAHRLARGEGVEIALTPGRGGAVVPLHLWRDRQGLLHLSRTKPGERMGLFRETGDASRLSRATVRGHDSGTAARPGTTVPYRVPVRSHPAAVAPLAPDADLQRMGLFRENRAARRARRAAARRKGWNRGGARPRVPLAPHGAPFTTIQKPPGDPVRACP